MIGTTGTGSRSVVGTELHSACGRGLGDLHHAGPPHPGPRGAQAPGSSAPTPLAVPPPLRLQPAPPGTADGARQRRRRPRGSRLRCSPRAPAQGPAGREPTASAALEDVAAARGGSSEPPDALQVGAHPLGRRGNLGRVCGKRVEKWGAALPQGAPTGPPGERSAGAKALWPPLPPAPRTG